MRSPGRGCSIAFGASWYRCAADSYIKLDGSSGLQPYGRLPSEVIYSISRRELNNVLLDAATGMGVDLRFEHRLEDADFAAGKARIRDLRVGLAIEMPMSPLLAADGAGSLVRRRLAAQGLIEADESPLEHGYKELSIPGGPSGGARLEREALHIWPRGGYMLIALPNQDGSFTATLFLPLEGASSFASLTLAARDRCVPDRRIFPTPAR